MFVMNFVIMTLVIIRKYQISAVYGWLAISDKTQPSKTSKSMKICNRVFPILIYPYIGGKFVPP